MKAATWRRVTCDVCGRNYAPDKFADFVVTTPPGMAGPVEWGRRVCRYCEVYAVPAWRSLGLRVERLEP